MKFFRKISAFIFAFIMFFTVKANATTITYPNTRATTTEEINALLNDNYLDYFITQEIREGDEIISSEDFYFRVDESTSEPEITPITEFQYEYESNDLFSNDILRGIKPGNPIDLGDKWNWIKLRMYVVKLNEPIQGNNYQVSIGYNWKRQPHVIAGKDVFGVASDGNFGFDARTMSGQTITPSITSPYGEVTNYTRDSDDVYEDVSGIALKHQLTASSFAKINPCGSLNVLGNNSASSATIGITYGHSQITGSFELSVDKSSASIAIKPAISYDIIRSTALIDF